MAAIAGLSICEASSHAQRLTERIVPPSASETGRPGGPFQPARRILVVEDEIVLALQIEECLADAGYEVIDVVHSAEDAIAEAVADRPDLVFMDVRLVSDGDGIDAAREILERTGIRSIFATAHADEETRARGAVARPLAWLEKPFGEAAILKAVDSAFQDLVRSGQTP